MQVERIKFERTGGFAGISIARDLKLDELSEEQAHRLSELLDDLGFDELPEQMSGAESMPDELSEEQAHRLSELLDDLGFDELPEQMTGTESMPDEFTYVITVETEKWQHTVVTGDASAPEKMQELLQFLNRLARRKKKQ